MESQYKRVLNSWVKSFRANHFDATTNKAINLATFDLWYSAPSDGSVNDPPSDEYGNENEWSGYDFVKACKLISTACEEVPSVLYINTEFEDFSESEPDQFEECPECKGTGSFGSYYDDDDEECFTCKGEGKVEAYLEGWWKVERKQLIEAILGKELANSL